MQVLTSFHHMQASPDLRDYATRALRLCEQKWRRHLQLHLRFMGLSNGVKVDLSGRDAAGHPITAVGQGKDAFTAFDNLYRQLRPQGHLLLNEEPMPSSSAKQEHESFPTRFMFFDHRPKEGHAQNPSAMKLLQVRNGR